jgi:hypothetical protein
MRVHEDQSVGLRQAGEGVRAFDQLVRSLAVRRSGLGDRLVEARRRPAAAVAEQQHFRDARLPAQELDPRLDVEGVVLEADRRLVVVGSRVHRQHHEAARGELGGGEMREEVARAMDQQHRNVRRGSGVRGVEDALDGAGREGDVDGTALGEGGRRRAQQRQRHCRRASHTPAPAWVSLGRKRPSRIE